MARPPSGYYGMSFPGEGGRQGGRSNQPTQYSIPTTPRNTRSMPDENIDGALINTLRTEAIAEVQRREENNPLKNLPSVLAGIGSLTRNRIVSGLQQGGTPVYENGIVVGVMLDGRYTGRPSSAPTEGDDPNPRPAAPPAADQKSAGTSPAPAPTKPTVEAPAPPGDTPVDTTTGEAMDAQRKRGRDTTIATSAQGLLTPARTRRRSLMAGLIR